MRADILGANDGIISISGIVLGATRANLDSRSLLITGISRGMLAGACSMAGGEWISVSTQRDLQVETMTSQASLKAKTIDAPQLHKKDLLMPLHAAGTSFLSFIMGALIPLLAITLSTPQWRIFNTACLMGLALCLNAVFSTLGNHISIGKTIIRNVLVGFLTIIITYILGSVLSV
ncbi:MAG: VIT1/CCC1 transporter family protein [Bombilactobacillus mellis]|nr:VIT1/CCC1 transporter family protein [Bombilactobacillus mellis]